MPNSISETISGNSLSVFTNRATQASRSLSVMSVKLASQKRTRLKLAFLARLKQCRLASLDEWLPLSLCLTKMDGVIVKKESCAFLLFLIHTTYWIRYTSNHFIPLILCSWGQMGCQMKRKSSRNSIFLVSAANFQLELNNLQKRPKYVSKCHFWEGFSKFVQLWLKNSGWNKNKWVP